MFTLLLNREMQIKTTTNTFTIHQNGYDEKQKQNGYAKHGEGHAATGTHILGVGKLVQSLWKAPWQCLLKLNIHIYL